MGVTTFGFKPDFIQILKEDDQSPEDYLKEQLDEYGLNLEATKEYDALPPEIVDQQYGHVPLDVRNGIHEYLGHKPYIVAVISGNNVVETVREEIVGDETDPSDAETGIRSRAVEPGTDAYDRDQEPYSYQEVVEEWISSAWIRDFGTRNRVHASDSTEEAMRDIQIHFGLIDILNEFDDWEEVPEIANAYLDSIDVQRFG